MRIDRRFSVTILAATLLLCGACRSNEDGASTGFAMFQKRVTVPSGTALDVRLGSAMSSESVRPGEVWSGNLTRPVVIDGREVIPAGSSVEGTVIASEPARRGSRARLQLGVRAVRIEARRVSPHARAETVIAGSPRARNVGAIVGGAAAGALLGKAIGGDGGDAAKGAIVGGAVATGAVAASKGYQVVLESGTVMTFVLSNEVAVAVN